MTSRRSPTRASSQASSRSSWRRSNRSRLDYSPPRIGRRVVPPDLDALIFDFDGLIIDSERVEADCIIEIVAEWGHTMSYRDIGHLFGSVDADEQWDELLGTTCGRTVT